MMLRLGNDRILMELLRGNAELVQHLVNHKDGCVVMSAVADIDSVDHRDIFISLMGNRSEFLGMKAKFRMAPCGKPPLYIN